MSIFTNEDEYEIENDMDRFIQLIPKYFLRYETFISNLDYSKFDIDFIKFFCNDSKKIYLIFRNLLISELSDEDEVNDSNMEELNELKILIDNLNILIENIPDEEFLNKKSQDEIINKLNCKEIKDSSIIIKNYFQKMLDGMKELNNSLKKFNEVLDEGVTNLEFTLKINKITTEFKEIVHNVNEMTSNHIFDKIKFNEHFNWMSTNIEYLKEMIFINKIDINKKFDSNLITKVKNNFEKLSEDEKKKYSKELNEMNLIHLINDMKSFIDVLSNKIN
jgi:hypothetical protein